MSTRSDLPRFLTTRVVPPWDEGAQLYIMADCFLSLSARAAPARYRHPMSKATAAGQKLRQRAAERDRLKEEVGHYKLWEGAVAAIGVALAGWLVSTGENAAPSTSWAAITCGALVGMTL